MEIIIADDASSDDTRGVVERYRNNYGFVHYFRHHRNKGNAFVRDTVLKHSKEHYIALMDDIEWLGKDKN
jgi:glycosyltransferase involved in cell wall biosynthesis